MKYKNILLEINNKTALITINRPKQLNALNFETILELNNVITDLENNKKAKCLIITGCGKKAFIAGADIKEFINYTQKQGEELARKGQALLFDLLEKSPIVSIAAINGFALGGGLELAMACHLRIASKNAKMGLPEVSLGVIPGYGGTQRLAQLVGKGRAVEMISTAKMITAEEASNWGLVNHICEEDQLILLAKSITDKIKKNSPLAISKAIKSINAGLKEGVNGFEVEKKEFGSCFGTKQFVEGTTAFLEKRKPKY